ncbi:MAG: hypothetical protein ACE5I3_13735, partial [Phycisphaerae bacterium]
MGDTNIHGLEQSALAYLKEQLADRAPQRLRLEGRFDERPLDGEAVTALFSFELQPGPGITSGVRSGALELKHYVAVGETEPNFFPAYG